MRDRAWAIALEGGRSTACVPARECRKLSMCEGEVERLSICIHRFIVQMSSIICMLHMCSPSFGSTGVRESLSVIDLPTHIGYITLFHDSCVQYKAHATHNVRTQSHIQ